MLKCEKCGKEKMVYRASTQNPPKCCSYECLNKWRSDFMKERNKNQFRLKDLSKNELKEHMLKRIRKHIRTKDSCWIWIGAKDKNGYGLMPSGLKGDQFPERRVHRIIWHLFNSPIEKGKVVCHKCDNPSCVNPEHLFIGLPKDNTEDMLKKGRGIKGETSPSSKFKEKDIKEMRKKFNQGVRPLNIMKEFNISRQHLHSIVTFKSWQHVK
ncbi:MAG: HNH endonuclease signature motif containing protein [Nitrosopumilaceae archaeon]|nr:HNH endonuclease signature motif containing protein [Nitrosopumilaceae archaeon]